MSNNPVPGFVVGRDLDGEIGTAWHVTKMQATEERNLSFQLEGEEYTFCSTLGYYPDDDGPCVATIFLWDNPRMAGVADAQSPFDNTTWQTIRERIGGFLDNMSAYDILWQESGARNGEARLELYFRLISDEGEWLFLMMSRLRLLEVVSAFVVGYLTCLGVKWITAD